MLFWFQNCVRRLFSGALPALLCLFALTDSALARPYYYIARPGFSTTLDYTYSNHKNVSSGGKETTSASHHFREGIEVQTAGWAYHPALLVYQLNLNPEWIQDQQQQDNYYNRTQNASSLLYRVSGRLLQYKPVNVDFHSSRSSSLSTNSWGATTQRLKSDYGGALNFPVKKWPMRLAYDSSDSLTEGFYTSRRISDTFRLSSYRNTDVHRTSLEINYEETVYEWQGRGLLAEQAVDLGRARMYSTWLLTDDERLKLDSHLLSNYLKTDGPANYTFSLNETLSFRHLAKDSNPQLNSSYAMGFDTDSDNNYTLPLSSAVTVSHQLYDNLTSSINGQVSQVYGRNYEQNGYDAGGGFAYHRRVPFGLVRMNLGSNYKVVDQTVTSRWLTVLNENVDLFYGIEVRLTKEQIDPQSIKVFADNILLRLDEDYTVTENGGIILLSHQDFDSDDPLAPVRTKVSYRYLGDPSAKLGTLTRSLGAGCSAWSWLSLNYSLSLTEDQLLAGDPPIRLRDDLSQRITLGTRYKKLSASLSLSEERYAQRETVRSWQLSGGLGGAKFWLWEPFSNMRLQLVASVGGAANTDNTESNFNRASGSGNTFNYNVRGNLNWQITPVQKVKAVIFQRLIQQDYSATSENDLEIETQSRSSSRTHSGASLSHIYRFAAWSIKSDYSLILEKDNVYNWEKMHNRFFFSLRRDLR